MKKLPSFLLFVFPFFAGAQVGTNPNYITSKTVLALNTGAQFFRYPGVELGLAYAKYSRSGHMSYGKGYGISGVVLVDSVPAYGPQISAWMTGGSYHICLAASAGFFLNKNGSTFRACPQIGFGDKRWRVTYGYSFAITGQDFLPANTHTVSFNLLIDVLKLKNRELGADKTLQRQKKKIIPTGQ
jgi:hypothetical protein